MKLSNDNNLNKVKHRFYRTYEGLKHAKKYFEADADRLFLSYL
ncbi:hypothetical protein I656_02128 [Geobacillus sp. WSUCF1]|nr:hypothetical protein I656_02128 [Geobacillus sp. WSUCF1]